MRNDMFGSVGTTAQATDTHNEAGGVAYSRTAKHELAQMAATGTFGDTYYVSATDQLARLKGLLPTVDVEFIAKLALYSREQGYMKDMPAVLCAALSNRGEEGIRYLKQVFPRAIDNGRMLRNYVQAIRSGQFGRKSLGTAPKRLVAEWVTDHRSFGGLFRDAVGTRPSIADIIKMVHPKPKGTTQEALFGYIIGKEYDASALPGVVQDYENFKAGDRTKVPNVDFRYLTSLELDDTVWVEIARNAGWQMTRMNLNTFSRHGVFKNKGMVSTIAERLRNAEAIAGSRVFPFQLLSAYRATEHNGDIPWEIRSALQDAVDLSVNNVPSFYDQKVVLCPDTSGSMGNPVMDQSQRGYIRNPGALPLCIDVAGLVTAAFLRSNPESVVLPFAHKLHTIKLNPRDTLTTNTDKLRRLGGGGTNCSLPLKQLNDTRATADLVIYISDYESWLDSNGLTRGCGTAMADEWVKFKRRSPKAKLVCIDCTPSRTIQAPDAEHRIINIGGFSDTVFDIVRKFADNTLGTDHWVGEIERTPLS